MHNPTHFIHWFRESSPYIHRFRRQTFVIAFGGEVVAQGQMPRLAQDLALLNSLGINVVLVHGAAPQIDAQLQQAGLASQRVAGRRITETRMLPLIEAATGVVRIAVEAALSQGVQHSPMAHARVRVSSGNFVVAQPLGVIDGVDLQHSGRVRRIDTDSIRQHLDLDEVVLLSPLGYSPSGEVFNITAEEVATEAAIALGAAKLIFLMAQPGVPDGQGSILRQLTLAQARECLAAQTQMDGAIRQHLSSAVSACSQGVERVHLISGENDGALLLELFSRDGSGTLVSQDAFENLRQACIDDVGGILELIRPLEDSGVLVKRSRETLEMETDHYTVLERDRQVVACVALHPYADEQIGEIACLVVHPDYRKQGRAAQLLDYVQQRAAAMGLKRLFVLTTQTAHWFVEQGFEPGDIDALPISRQQHYNKQRRSKVFVKSLG